MNLATATRAARGLASLVAAGVLVFNLLAPEVLS